MQLKYFKSSLVSLIFLTLLFSSLPAKKKNNLTIDFSERFRFVSWDNPITLDSSKENGNTFTRNRTSLGLNWNLSKNTEFYFKITNEFRTYFKPKKDFNVHEIFIDNLYLKIRNIFKIPVTLTLGRQNIFLGEGFIVLDGNTYDGSRSAYFDAVRVDIKFKKGGNLTLLKMNAQRTDDVLPVLNDKDQRLNEHDIKGCGFYYQGKLDRNLIDIYFIKKKTDVNDNRSWVRSTDTLGTKLVLRIRKDFNLTTEVAIQNGSFDNEKMKTLGGHFHLDRKIKNKTLKKATIGGVYLSGNSPGDKITRGWDPPFSKWPKWSNSYIYTLINENGIANWSNISSVYMTFLAQLFKNGYLSTTFNFLSAPEKDLSPNFPGGSGRFRGFLLTNKLNFNISKTLSGHFLWEHFRPGNFYFDNAKPYNWFRFELMYKK